MDKVVITIARGYGSGGRTLGKLLAQELGIPFYDREIMRMASDESGISENLFGQADEKVKNTSLFRIAKKVYTGELIPPDSDDFVSNDNLFNYQAKVIKNLAAEESCVIIGRCADFILKEHENVLRLYFYAPLQDCIKRVQDTMVISEKDAVKKIQVIDKHRAEYYKYYTGHEWNDAKNYDFCLNTASLNYEKLVQVVKSYVGICSTS